LSNALYMLFMGLSPAFWGPLAQVYGRRNVCFKIILIITNSLSM
jgi:MFS family permease